MQAMKSSEMGKWEKRFFVLGLLVCGAPAFSIIFLEFVGVKIDLPSWFFIVYFSMAAPIAVYFIVRSWRRSFNG